VTLEGFEKAVEQCQERFDSVVEYGTDEDLFISSYLAGHFDLIVGQAFIHQDYVFDNLNHQLINSLNTAFISDNLTADEQEKTMQLWQILSSYFES
jgi:hypothetical protein